MYISISAMHVGVYLDTVERKRSPPLLGIEFRPFKTPIPLSTELSQLYTRYVSQ
jgi:hypothetical protein